MYLGAQSLTLVKKEMVFISQGTYLISEVRARVLFYFIQAYTYLGIYSTLRSKRYFSDTTLVWTRNLVGNSFAYLPCLDIVFIKNLLRLVPTWYLGGTKVTD